MKPYEETWGADGYVVLDDEAHWVARFSPAAGVSPDIEAARARLAAQAPAMARLLILALRKGVFRDDILARKEVERVLGSAGVIEDKC